MWCGVSTKQIIASSIRIKESEDPLKIAIKSWNLLSQAHENFCQDLYRMAKSIDHFVFVNSSKEETRMEAEEAATSNASMGTLSAPPGGIEGGKKGNVVGTREWKEALKEIKRHFELVYCAVATSNLSKMLEISEESLKSGHRKIDEKYGELKKSIITQQISPKLGSLKPRLGSLSSRTEHKTGAASDELGPTLSQTLSRLHEWDKKLKRQQEEFENARVASWDAEMEVSSRLADIFSDSMMTEINGELQTQIIDLIQSLHIMWKIMSKSHENQMKITENVTLNVWDNFELNATLKLLTELQVWQKRVVVYIAKQEALVKNLHAWLSNFQGHRANSPMLVEICDRWLSGMIMLPKVVSINALKESMKRLKDRQSKEGQQRKRVISLRKKVDGNKCQYKKKMESLSSKLNKEEAKRESFREETQRATSSELHHGFGLVFWNLTKLSKDCVKIYEQLLKFAQPTILNETNKF
ncbi:protein of unknown function DUF632 [Dillenia turbinata]|uniref:DUF632 domain-containing protein n=1 Tax=Dillenia turbinata TaxID=194707 RepID=A0AAN8W5I6_9MAGN